MSRESAIPRVPESQFGVAPPTARRRKPKVEFDREAGEWVGNGYYVTLRKGRAAGRDSTRRAFSAKKQLRSSEEVAVVRGDKVFNHEEYVSPAAAAAGQFEMVAQYVALTPNDERTAWQRAGTTDKGAWREKTLQGSRAHARTNASRSIAERVIEAAEIVRRKNNGKVRPSWIAYVLVREDLKFKRYPLRGVKQKAAQARYLKAARAYLASPVVRHEGAPDDAAMAKAAKRQPIVRLVEKCGHEWVVTPKRTKRTCSACGAVDRKARGKWSRVQAKVEAPKPRRQSRQEREAAVERLMGMRQCSREDAERRLRKVRQIAR